MDLASVPWVGIIAGVASALGILLPALFKRRAAAAVERERALTTARNAARVDRADIEKATREFIELLQKQTAEDRARITTLEGSLQKLRERATGCLEKIVEMQTSNAALLAKISSLEGDIVALKAENASLREALGALSGPPKS